MAPAPFAPKSARPPDPPSLNILLRSLRLLRLLRPLTSETRVRDTDQAVHTRNTLSQKKKKQAATSRASKKKNETRKAMQNAENHRHAAARNADACWEEGEEGRGGLGPVSPSTMARIPPPSSPSPSPVRHAGSGMAQGGRGLARSPHTAATNLDCGASSKERSHSWPNRGSHGQP